MFFKAIERSDIAAVTHRGKTVDSYIDSNGSCGSFSWAGYFSLGLNGNKPLFATLFDSDIT